MQMLIMPFTVSGINILEQNTNPVSNADLHCQISFTFLILNIRKINNFKINVFFFNFDEPFFTLSSVLDNKYRFCNSTYIFFKIFWKDRLMTVKMNSFVIMFCLSLRQNKLYVKNKGYKYCENSQYVSQFH